MTDEERLREAELTIVRLQERQDAAAAALSRARVEIDRRLEGMNELREQISSERGTYVNRDVLESKMNGLEGRLSAVEGRLAMVNISAARHEG